MSLNILIPLATASTDVERAFSEGRREVNFMQHNMSSQTFKVEMAVGSWDGTPLMPDISNAICIMEKHMSSAHEGDTI
jgi:hypothetical protein